MHSNCNYIIRDATINDANKLTELAFISKAYWGYSEAWLELWREQLTVTSEMIVNSTTLVAELSGTIIGFWCRSNINTDEISAGLLFIHPQFMGKGIAKSLYLALKPKLIKRGITSFKIEADPNAVAFYLKIGAIKIGENASKIIAGRKIPILEFDLTKD